MLVCMSSDFERCEHGLTAAYCPDCIAEIRAASSVPTGRVPGRVITTSHAGDCQCCGFRYPAGTTVVWVDDGDAILGWVAIGHYRRYIAVDEPANPELAHAV